MSHRWKSRIKTPGQVKRNASINRGFSIDSTDTVVDESFTDTMTLVALVTGTFGLTMKHTTFAWISFFSCMVSVTNAKSTKLDISQLVSTFSIAVMALVMSYMAGEKSFSIFSGAS